MLELVVLAVFCLQLIVFVAAGVAVTVPLSVGFILFYGYGLMRGHDPVALVRMALSGVSTARGVIESFVLIGILTALWRASGTISQVVVMASPLVTPAAAPLATFALTSLMPFLMGTAFGTAATMGVVCMTMAHSMGANALLCGGAVLAGAYFGDRVSPMSSSSLLVRSITHTSLGGNFRAMMRSSLVPLVVAAAAYGVLGVALAPATSGDAGAVSGVLASYFSQGVVALLPVVPVLVLPLLKVGMKRSMAASIALAAIVCVLVRGVAPAELLQASVFGYVPADPGVARIMSGGGILSMANVTAIVCLSSSFAGLFEGTGLLDGVRGHVDALADTLTPFGAVLAVVVPASMVACNQTLGTMLAHELCAGVEGSDRELALDLEDSAVVVSPLVPWSAACGAVASMCAAPATCWLAAFYLWLIPVWHLAASLAGRRGSRASKVSRGLVRLTLGAAA